MILLAFALTACSTSMEDNSLEASSLSGLEGDGPTGELSVTAGAEEGDWELMIDDQPITYHSPSHVDLSLLAGETVTAMETGSWGAGSNFSLWQEDAMLFAISVMGDGSREFGEQRWTYGELLGHGVVPHRDGGEISVDFYSATIHGDDGNVTALPGEPVTVVIDGVTWRLTVVASYQLPDEGFELLPRDSCGPSPMLVVELVRDEEEPGEPLVRPANLRSPTGGCG